MNISHGRMVFTATATVFLIAIAAPYLAANLAGGADHVFGGFLLNPLDGNSYLAKMTAGWQGHWLFTLPYTAEKGEGHFLFVFYLFLGHLARGTRFPLVLTFHLARLAGAMALLWALYRFLQIVLPTPRLVKLAFVLAALGSGLGWLALPFGRFSSDFWVAETYPFLSAYANPHFPLGLALVLWLLTPAGEHAAADPGRDLSPLRDTGRRPAVWNRLGWAWLASLALAVILPFGVVTVLAVLAILLLSDYGSAVKQRSGQIDREPDGLIFRGLVAGPEGYFFAILLGGTPLLLYDFWITRADPLLAGWNSQNVTTSPPGWDLLLSLSPALFLALAGAWAALKETTPGRRVLLAWAGAGLLLLILPFGLQRRFMLGLYIPIAALAALGVQALARARAPSRYRLLAVGLVLFAVPTNLVILLAARHGIQARDPQLYLTRGEAQALEWLRENTPAEALILAAPETGLLIPAYTGRRVIYGHPFETVNAVAEKESLAAFFKAGGEPRALLAQRGVDYIFIGPRERQLNLTLAFPDLAVLYQAKGVTLYAAPPAQ